MFRYLLLCKRQYSFADIDFFLADIGLGMLAKVSWFPNKHSSTALCHVSGFGLQQEMQHTLSVYTFIMSTMSLTTWAHIKTNQWELMRG